MAESFLLTLHLRRLGDVKGSKINRAFSIAKLQFDRIGRDGKLSLHQTIELTDGRISDYQQHADDEKMNEEFTLTYANITVNGIYNGVVHPT